MLHFVHHVNLEQHFINISKLHLNRVNPVWVNLESSLMSSDICSGFRPNRKLLRACLWVILMPHRSVSVIEWHYSVAAGSESERDKLGASEGKQVCKLFVGHVYLWTCQKAASEFSVCRDSVRCCVCTTHLLAWEDITFRSYTAWLLKAAEWGWITRWHFK